MVVESVHVAGERGHHIVELQVVEHVEPVAGDVDAGTASAGERPQLVGLLDGGALRVHGGVAGSMSRRSSISSWS